MIVAVGVDMIELARIQRLLEHGSDRFLQRVFTAGERDYCLSRHRPVESLAARFCAKEAVMKCLGTGWAQGVGFQQIEVLRSRDGAVAVGLHAVAAARAAAAGIRSVHLSLSHTEHHAIAFAVAEG